MNKKPVRVMAFLLAIGALLGCLPVFRAFAVVQDKTQPKRSIAIVFDNSGSMYGSKSPAWACAIYAMEVFARMMNDGDTLLIYPMHPITCGTEDGLQEYSMTDPLVVHGASGQVSPDPFLDIRKIYTPKAVGTPIETITKAYAGLVQQPSDNEKWLIVLTDGDSFDGKSQEATKQALSEKLGEYNQSVNVLYLGILVEKQYVPVWTAGNNLTGDAKIASKAIDVPGCLTEMCNTIFVRDILPANHITSISKGQKKLNLDVSMKKLIVFIQGEGISNVVLVNGAGRTVQATKESETQYPQNRAGNYRDADTEESLQGRLLIYDYPEEKDDTLKCGNFSLSYTYQGEQEPKVEIYYAPDVQMMFTFADKNNPGVNVDPNDLYEGDYILSYGMMDGKTGAFTDSELLGKIIYDGAYHITRGGEIIDQDISNPNGEKSGSEIIHLQAGDKFNAEMTVTYLGGYRIHKDSSDFDWPDGGIEIKLNKPKALAINVESPANTTWQLAELEEGDPFRVTFSYDGNPLTGAAFDAVEFNWQQDEGAVLDVQKGDDCYIIYLKHKNPAVPGETPIGTFSVNLSASYTEPSSERADATTAFSYTIEYNSIGIEIVLDKKQDYFVIRDIKGSEELITTATVKLSEGEMTPEQMQALQFSAVCEKEGIDIIVRQPNENEPVYEIWLKGSDALKEGSYTIKFNASTIDDLGHTVPAKEKVMSVSMSTIPRWLKILIISLIALLLLLIILAILHIKALPTKLHTTKRQCQMTVDGEDVSPHTVFDSKLEKKRVTVMSKYAGKKIGVVMDVKPGKGSYVRTPQVKRIAEVASSSVKKQGNAQVSEILIGSVKYAFNEDTKKFERMPKSDKPFNLRNGATVVYRGTFQSNGDDKDFSTSVKLNFKKKK